MADQSVERARGGLQLLAVGKAVEMGQQFFNRGMADAGQVAAAFGFGGGAAEVVVLLVAGAFAVAVVAGGYVKIEVVHAFLVHGGIGGAHVHGNADFGEVALPFGGNAFVVLAWCEEFKGQRFALFVHCFAVFVLVSAFFKQGACFEQVRAHTQFGVGNRRHRDVLIQYAVG